MPIVQPFKGNHNKILNYIIWLILSFLFLRLAIFNFQMTFYPFPLEYREGALLLSTNLLVKGGNPYDLVYQPEYTNIYGIFYPLVVYPFAKLFGATITVHRAVSSFFNLASCLVIFWVMRRMRFSLILAFLGALIFYWHLLLGHNLLIRPDTLGLFLFLCSIVISWRYNYSYKSLIVSLFLGILAFMTKPYFVLSIAYVAIYVFTFKSKKKAIQYSVLSFIYLAIAILLLNYFFETYFNNTIFVYLNIKLAGTGFEYAFGQLNNYIAQNLGIMIILLAVSLLVCIGFIKSLSKNDQLQTLGKFTKINLFNSKKPLLNVNFDFFGFCLIFSLLIFSFKLGQFTGNWMGYTYHLISPFLIIVGLRLLKELPTKALVLCLLIISLNLLFVFPESKLTNESTNRWNKLVALVSQHQNIMNSPAIAPILTEQGKTVYDSGHSEYFIVGSEREILNLQLPWSERVKQRYNQFTQEVDESLKDQKYDLLIMTQNILPYPEKVLEECYEYQETLPVDMLANQWKLDIWKPRASGCK